VFGVIDSGSDLPYPGKLVGCPVCQHWVKLEDFHLNGQLAGGWYHCGGSVMASHCEEEVEDISCVLREFRVGIRQESLLVSIECVEDHLGLAPIDEEWDKEEGDGYYFWGVNHGCCFWDREGLHGLVVCIVQGCKFCVKPGLGIVKILGLQCYDGWDPIAQVGITKEPNCFSLAQVCVAIIWDDQSFDHMEDDNCVFGCYGQQRERGLVDLQRSALFWWRWALHPCPSFCHRMWWYIWLPCSGLCPMLSSMHDLVRGPSLGGG